MARRRYFVLIEEIIDKCYENIVESYSNTAILLNAADVAVKRYSNETNIIALSTTANIPPEFLVNPSKERIYSVEDLVIAYKFDVIKKLAEDFLISTISKTDIMFENIYQELLINDGIPSEDISRRMNTPWRTLTDYFRTLELAEPFEHRFHDSFEIYLVWRQFRHALLHSDGILKENHYRSIRNSERKIQTHDFTSLLDIGLIDDQSRLNLNYEFIFALRQWALSTLPYFKFVLLKTFNS